MTKNFCDSCEAEIEYGCTSLGLDLPMYVGTTGETTRRINLTMAQTQHLFCLNCIIDAVKALDTREE